MKIYIASSWKNQHTVEMLTALLRERGHEVLSFVENNYGEGRAAKKPMDFEKWVQTDKAWNSFTYDTNGATQSDIVIYISPSGLDAWAEVGAAWGCGKPVILGLYAKGESVGLMRKMVAAWFDNYKDLLNAVDEWRK
jgi:nucleoside 2-deoxyribosyltransferase